MRNIWIYCVVGWLMSIAPVMAEPVVKPYATPSAVKSIQLSAPTQTPVDPHEASWAHGVERVATV